jgi:hypothetical protein
VLASRRRKLLFVVVSSTMACLILYVATERTSGPAFDCIDDVSLLVGPRLIERERA